MAKLIASPTGLAKIKQARKEKGWNLNDPRWLESASEVLGVVPQEGKFASGISYGTWKRFLSGKYHINNRAFQAYQVNRFIEDVFNTQLFVFLNRSSINIVG